MTHQLQSLNMRIKMGHIFVSWLHPFKEHRFVILRNGMLHFEDSYEDKPLLFHDKKVSEIPNPRFGDVKKVSFKNEHPLENELRYFISKLDGKIELASGRDGAAVIRMLEPQLITSKKKEIKYNEKLKIFHA